MIREGQAKVLKSLLDTDKGEDIARLLPVLDAKSGELKRSLQDAEYIEGGINRLLEGLEGGIRDFSIPDGYREVERYFVNKPYAVVSILYNDDRDEYLYYVVEPRISEVESFFLADIEDKLGITLLFTEVEEGVKGGKKEKILRKKIEEVVERYHIEFESASLRKISYYLVRDLIQFGKIDVLMRDRFVEDISCDGYNIPVYVYHWIYGSTATNIAFNEPELDSFVVKIAQKGGKHLSLSEPMVGITLEDGSRAQLSLGSEITTRGSTFTIRRFREVLITAADLIRWGTFTPEEMAYLWLCVENGKSILFVGGTASGKTTSLNAIALFMPQSAKIVTIEDTRELRLPHENWIPGVTRTSFMGSERGTVDMYELLKVALRQRPEYLIVGEVRGKEAMTLFQAMSTGHTSFSTFHADSVDATIHRLEYPPLSIPRSMLQALDIFSIQAQVFIGNQRVRRNLEITENLGIDPTTRNIKTRRIFEWNPAKDTFDGLNIPLPAMGKSNSHVTIMVSEVLKEIGRFNGWSGSQLSNEFKTRAQLLKLMAEREVTPQEFISTIRTFQANPEKAKKEYGI
ncbi:MAG: type II/IV secretion system ATPase subunit [Methanophagales archaeon]|nr:type II/IV secretion system ATPase subunit [Methanophagales archaeon]